MRCGDGRLSVDGNETCDDGNVVEGDGCNNLCQIENHTLCTHSFSQNVQFDESTELYTVDPPDSDCVRRICGDGKINLAWEMCDDGNKDDLDGCSSECTEELGYTCTHSSSLNINVFPIETVEREVCTPFVARPWPQQAMGDCPLANKCAALGECGLYRHRPYCVCKLGYSMTGQGDMVTTYSTHNPLLDMANLSRSAQHCQDVNE